MVVTSFKGSSHSGSSSYFYFYYTGGGGFGDGSRQATGQRQPRQSLPRSSWEEGLQPVGQAGDGDSDRQTERGGLTESRCDEHAI